MLNEKFVEWVRKDFSTVSFQGNPKSKKLKCMGKVFKTDEAFTVVQDAYKDAIAGNKVESTDAVLIKSGSPEAAEVLGIIMGIAKENKKAHARHENTRREAEVSGSLGDTMTRMNEAPSRPNKMDIAILGHFCLASTDTMREVFYKDADGNLHSLGMYSDGARSVQSIAEAMAHVHPIDVSNSYETVERGISSSYNAMQTMTDEEIANTLKAKEMDKWPEIQSLHVKDLESVLVAMIAHYRAHSLPVLMWALGYVNLFRITSTKQEGEAKVSWTSGFRFKTNTGMLNDDVTYYSNALRFPQYFEQIQSPKRFGDIYRISEKPIEGNVLKRYQDSPFLKCTFSSMSVNQMKVFCACWYCYVHRIPAPGLLHQDNGGNMKNGLVEVITEGASEMWDCPRKAVYFKLERDQLANKDRKYHVKTDGLCKRTLLDSLFVFYDEVTPSKDMWEEYKSLSGANQVSVNVRPLYGDPYTVTDAPVPFYMTRNTYMPLYERGPMLRRLVVIRTSAANTYLELLDDEERKMLDDPQVRKDTFATLMHLGKKAYDEIETKGGMLNINNIFLDIGSVLGSASEDYTMDMQYFYKSLFVNATEDRIVMESDKVWKDFVKIYPDLDEDENRKAIEMKLSAFLLGLDVRNKKVRVRRNNKRPTVYVLYKNEVISAMPDPDSEVL